MSGKDVLQAFVFIVTLLIYTLCEKWMQNTKAVGNDAQHSAHPFQHTFFLWTLKMLLQAGFLLVWKAIQLDKCGLGRFKHVEEPPAAAPNPQLNIQANLGAANGEAEEEGEHQVGNAPGLLYGRKRRKITYNKLLFFPPTCFMTARVLFIYFGTMLTYPSSFIMLKGSMTLFVALMSLAFLAKQIRISMWVGVVIVAIGFAGTGISDYVHTTTLRNVEQFDSYGIAAGDLLIAMAQIMIATRIVFEEKYMRRLSIDPMFFLGAEGVVGSVIAIILLIVFSTVETVSYSYLPSGYIEDIGDAFCQMSNCSSMLIPAFLGSLITYVIFTYLGMVMIKKHGALPRIMVEALSWAIMWAIALGLKWEHFYIVQIPSLAVIVFGLLIYSQILVIPCLQRQNVEGVIGANNEFNDLSDDENNADNQDENDDDDEAPLLPVNGVIEPVAGGEHMLNNDHDDALLDMNLRDGAEINGDARMIV